MNIIHIEWVAAVLLFCLLTSGAIQGIRDGKFVLGRRFGFTPYPVSRAERPVQFWVVATALALFGVATPLALGRRIRFRQTVV